MSQLYTPPGKAARSLIVHRGALASNQTDGGTVPSQYAYRSQSVVATYPLDAVSTSSPAFVDLAAGAMLAAAYDEAVFDVQPVVTWDAGTLTTSVSTTHSAQAYSDIATCGTPFWLSVSPQGYGVPHLVATRQSSLDAALAVMSQLYSDLQARQLLTRFLGFAFSAADLNVLFYDRSVIDRTFQSTLVQQCWGYGVGACMLTSRPGDYLSLAAPVIGDYPSLPPVQNPNSGIPLAHPILGCNLAIRDKIVIVYPLDQTTAVNGTVVLGQLVTLTVPNNRDPGVSPNLDVAYAVPFDDSMWSADGSGGVTASSTASQAARVLRFAASYGVTSLGVLNTEGSTDVLSPPQFMPPDSLVNTTGSRVAWASDSSIFVAYSDGQGGTAYRQFSSSLAEVTPYAGPTLW